MERMTRPVADTVFDLRTRLSAAEQRATDAEALLRELEWRGPPVRGGQAVGQRTCLVCGNRKMQGHETDCGLAAFLARTKGATT